MIRVTKLWAYFGGTSGTVAGCKLAIWGTGGTLIYASQTFTAAHSRQWQSIVPSTVVLLNPSSAIFVGWWAPVGSNMEWGVRSTGSWQGRKNVTPVGTMAGATINDGAFVAGEAGGYLEYVPAGGLGLASGGTFAKYAMKRYNVTDTAWHWHPLKRYNGATAQWEWLA